MKKSIALAICLFLCNTFLYAELTKAQLWAISLPGILTEARGGYRNSLNDMAMNENGRNSVLTTLRRDWGITTREQLLDMLDSLENGGHAASFKEIQWIVNEIIEAGNDGSVISAILNKVEWDRVKVNRFNYVNKNWEKYQNVTLKGWDLGRSVSLCRWGYNVGFMTEAEAWKRIFHIASTIQPLYSSWEEYGYDYFMGRLFWASSSGEEESYLRTTEPIYNRLLNSYWGWLDWDVDLEAEEEDVIIHTRRFLPPADNDRTVQFLSNDSAMYNRYYWQTTSTPTPENSDPNIYEIKAMKISGQSNIDYGMIFCANDTPSSSGDFYRFNINVNGRFSVHKRIGNVWEYPLIWRDSPYLKTGYGVYNTLRVERVNDENGAVFRIFINGNFAVAFRDDNPFNGRNFAPFVSVGTMEYEQFPHIPVDVRFEY